MADGGLPAGFWKPDSCIAFKRLIAYCLATSPESCPPGAGVPALVASMIITSG